MHRFNPFSPMRRPSSLLAALFWLAALAPAPAAPPGCDPSGARGPARLDRIGEMLDLVLADGRLIYFPTLEPPRATPAAPTRPHDVAAELTALLAGKNLLILPLAAPDRWGRLPVRLFIEGESESADETLAAAGLAMASAEPGACGGGVLASEQEARAAKLGIWADAAFAPLAPDDAAVFFPRAGTLAIVEGQIRSVGRTNPRAYLNFAGRRGGASLVIARRNLPAFERAGFSGKTLVNRRIRARGVVEIGASPQIELFHPGQIEFIEETLRRAGVKNAESPERN
jgi:micrococcal nuclease